MSSIQPFHSTGLAEGEPVLTPAKFALGDLGEISAEADRVYWFRVPTQDFGIVVNRFYCTEGSVQALGWHYTIQLDPHNPSFAHCKTDFGFEDDLALMKLGGTDAE